jgi:type IV secretory pathway VirJ component
MQIDESAGHSANALDPREESRERRANGTVERDTQPSKMRSPSVRTEAGRQTPQSDEHSAKAASSIDESLVPDSKTIVRSDAHREKQPEERRSTAAGIRIIERSRHTEKLWQPMVVTEEGRSRTESRR